MKNLIFLMSLLMVSCDEFYDEDFERDMAGQNETAVTAYSASLFSLDPAATELSGTGQFTITNNEVVNLDINVQGVPPNYMQLHYSLTPDDCSLLTLPFPSEGGTTRSFRIVESTTTAILSSDLRSSGIDREPGNLGLEEMSLVVRGFSNVIGVPPTSISESFPLACGALEPAAVPAPNEPGPPPTTTGNTVAGTDGTTGGTTIGGTTAGTTAGGTLGTTTGTDIGGTLTGGVDGTVDGTVGGTTGGTVGGVGGGTTANIGGTGGGVSTFVGGTGGTTGF